MRDRRWKPFGSIAIVTIVLGLCACSGRPSVDGTADSESASVAAPAGEPVPAAPPRVATAAETEGLRLLAEQRLDAAAESFRSAIVQDRTAAEPRFLLGVCEAGAGRYDAARSALSDAIALDPEHHRARLLLARVLAYTGDDGEAIEHFRRAADTRPDDVDVRVEMAAAMMRAERASEAVGVLDDVVVREPSRADVRVVRAWALVAANRWAEAKTALESDLGEFPQDPRFALMITRLIAAAPDPSVRDADKAVRMSEALVRNLPSPDSAEILAMAYAQAGRFDEAIAVLSSARDVLARSPDPSRSDRFDRLEQEFRARRPCRQPWPEDAPGLRPPPAPPLPPESRITAS